LDASRILCWGKRRSGCYESGKCCKGKLGHGRSSFSREVSLEISLAKILQPPTSNRLT
jgi:hypothetical protein